MRALILSGLSLMLISLGLTAAEVEPALQKGKEASALLLEVSRRSPRTAAEAPDGIVLRFLVVRNAGNQERFAITETRDAIVGGKSYQQATQAALGKTFEPHTEVDAAPKFFARHPAAKAPAGIPLERAVVVSIELSGAPLEAGQPIETTGHFSFGTKIEDFPVTSAVPSK